MNIRSQQIDSTIPVPAGESLSAGDWICFKWDGVNNETRAYKAVANDSTRILARGYLLANASVGQYVQLHTFGDHYFTTNTFLSTDIGKKIYLNNTLGSYTLDITTLPRNGTTFLVQIGTVTTRKSFSVDVQIPVGPLIAGGNDMSVVLDHTTGNLETATISGGSSGETLLASVGSIDGTSLGTTAIFTPLDGDYVVTKAIITLTTATGITQVGTASIGIGGTFDNVFPSTELIGLNAVGKTYTFSTVLGAQVAILLGQTLNFEIDTIYTATTATLKVYLFGFLLV